MNRHKTITISAPANRRDYDVLVLVGRLLLDFFIVGFFYMVLRGPLGFP
jgi:hypothetical protein